MAWPLKSPSRYERSQIPNIDESRLSFAQTVSHSKRADYLNDESSQVRQQSKWMDEKYQKDVVGASMTNSREVLEDHMNVIVSSTRDLLRAVTMDRMATNNHDDILTYYKQ